MDAFYIVCKGVLSLEKAGLLQETSGIGASFGEAGLLAVSETAPVTATSLETSLIQVLHRQVFHRGLARFPSQVEHFDHLAVKLLSHENALEKVPILEGCSEQFKQQLAQRCTTRLLRENECLVQKSSTRGSLCVVRSGSAVAEEVVRPRPGTESPRMASERRFYKWDVVNADVVLGLVPWAPQNVMVDNFCAVTEIQDTDFINILQNFPEEVPPLVSRISILWPLEASQVPFLSGMSQSHFASLLEDSQWTMHMADRTVVRQNKEGDALHLLCYGLAVRVVDDVVLGNPLVQGEVIGRANFLGLAKRYPLTVRTQSVCHFRTLTYRQLQQRMETEFPLREWYELAKVQVQNFVEYDHAQQKVEIFHAKMRRRTEQAFNKHVHFTRVIRAKKEGILDTKAKELVQEFLESTRKPEEERAALTSAREVSEDWVALQETYNLLRSSKVSSLPSQKSFGTEVEQCSNQSGFSSEHSGPKVESTAPNRRVPSKNRNLEGSPSVQVVLQRRLPAQGAWRITGDPRQVQGAIHSFCREKEKEYLKGRLLRIMRNDYETGDATLEDEESVDTGTEASLQLEPDDSNYANSSHVRRPPRLCSEELQRLDELLPALTREDSSVDSTKRLLGRALGRKFQNLTQVASLKRRAVR